ncbi:hypothetical protein SAMN04488066_1248 [Halorubrum aquaticum]|uniref:DUF8052 domain-containing protein n=1 Tax=Halorubrum aquaticum TaxID=387340 RepID=A0A1I3CKZ2_9EURY|nr:hypothetical protein [Halorubrum aquaticum]SFH74986.1 hypothetical protein SAMN04488066_1248 [Halorubrum aquaticum]
MAERDSSGGEDEGPKPGTAPRHDPEELPAEIREGVPDYDDEYLDRVSDRLLYSYDLDADYAVDGERFELYAELRMRNQKQFLHPALSYADHETKEYLFARRVATPTVGELKRLVDLGHEVADERVEGDEQHYGTDVTFVLVGDRLPEAVADFVDGFRDRTLLKFGYYGHYEVNLIVVAPETESIVASEAAGIADAFRLWEPVEPPDEGFFSRFAKRFWR